VLGEKAYPYYLWLSRRRPRASDWLRVIGNFEKYLAWIGQDDDGRWYYRYQYTDGFGKRRNSRRLATSESNAKSFLRKALNGSE